MNEMFQMTQFGEKAELTVIRRLFLNCFLKKEINSINTIQKINVFNIYGLYMECV